MRTVSLNARVAGRVPAIGVDSFARVVVSRRATGVVTPGTVQAGGWAGRVVALRDVAPPRVFWYLYYFRLKNYQKNAILLETCIFKGVS